MKNSKEYDREYYDQHKAERKRKSIERYYQKAYDIKPHQIEQFKKRQQLKRALKDCPLDLQQQVLTAFSV